MTDITRSVADLSTFLHLMAQALVQAQSENGGLPLRPRPRLRLWPLLCAIFWKQRAMKPGRTDYNTIYGLETTFVNNCASAYRQVMLASWVQGAPMGLPVGIDPEWPM